MSWKVNIKLNKDFYGTLDNPNYGGQFVLGMWNNLATYFDIERVSEGGYGINYGFSGDTYTSRGGQDADKKSGHVNMSTMFFVPQAVMNKELALMHETLHALGVSHNNSLPRWMTVMNSDGGITGQGVPYLRIADYEFLKGKMGLKRPDVNSYSWKYEDNVYWTYVNGEKIRSYGVSTYIDNFIYEILDGKIKLLDLSNIPGAKRVDLRASKSMKAEDIRGSVTGGSIIGTQVHQMPYNLYNATTAQIMNVALSSASESAVGNQFNNMMQGNAGNDTLAGLGGTDTLDGGDGSDTADYSKDFDEGGTRAVIVNLSSKTKYGVKQNQARDGWGKIDTLVSIENAIGTKLSDFFYGNEGDNIFAGGAGNDLIEGGDGNDTADYSRDNADSGAKHGIRVNLSSRAIDFNGIHLSAHQAIDGFDNSDTLISIENVIGSDFDDFIVGGDGMSTIFGGKGNDVIWSAVGGGRVDGGEGDDVLYGGAGNDLQYGGSGNDSLYGGDGNDKMWGGNGSDSLWGGSGNDQLLGGSDADFLDGGDNNDMLLGENGNDTLKGGSGNDQLLGGNDNDELYGQDGNDRLAGQAGDDTLTGGDGADTFVFRIGYGNDLVTDFAVGTDRLELDKRWGFNKTTLQNSAHDSAAGLVFDFGNNQTLTLAGIHKSDFNWDQVFYR